MELESWWEFSRLKNGKQGKRIILQAAWYCPYNTCGRCGRMGGERSVRNRWELERWNVLDPNDYRTPTIYMLCMPCWNKIKAVIKYRRDADEIGRLARKLLREVANGNKGGGNAREPDGVHREN